ncbi:hypothetical protein [Dyella nitratireducens]|uniref:Uncharacterized protein n=1 Tax=Dyella nitratireducens TaxID=1849580 RepID=A0ABQ1GBR0_9GAMM|nr:hypothetical protein [Dyella nitratireducens]GGA40674.1 hypothetical protein GCM10010981_32360 [Dyella nitratireducens]GLQ40594.1 hypothetical protein GCM10007902_04430 [Dyella nitratireducens]
MKLAAISSALFILTASIASAQQPSSAQTPAHGVPNETDSSFSKATQIHGIGIPPGQLVASLPDLKQQASIGNAQAAAKLAAALLMCNAQASRSTADSFYQEHCVGLTPEDINERGKWLSVAASGGDVEAQYGYAQGGQSAIVGTQLDGGSPVTLSVYKENARKYLLGLAQKCNIDAISLIALDGRRNGMFFGNEPDTSYKFLLVYEAIARKPMVGSIAADQKQLEDKIASGTALSSARQEADAFVNEYCK